LLTQTQPRKSGAVLIRTIVPPIEAKHVSMTNKMKLERLVRIKSVEVLKDFWAR
jgi:hypothetical protein